MIPKILISLLTLFVLFNTYNSINDYKKGISIALSFSIFITWFDFYKLLLSGILIFITTTILTIYKGLVIRELNVLEKLNFIFIGFFSGVGMLFSFMHWPFTNIISLLMLLPIILYLYISIKTQLKFYKKYLFLSILVLDCVFRFLRLF
jgi:hypothetical protein